MADFTSPSGAPSGANLLFFCISTGISSLRKASICHCGDPYQTESLPHMTWSVPRPRTSVPTRAAASGGLDTAQVAKDVPISPYTLLTPNLDGISARSVAQSIRPVCRKAESMASGGSRNIRRAE